jgi:hypothetical protein
MVGGLLISKRTLAVLLVFMNATVVITNLPYSVKAVSTLLTLVAFVVLMMRPTRS